MFYKYISSKPKKQIFIIVGITEQQYKAISKYWEKKGGPNFYDGTPFRMFKIPRERNAILELAKRHYGEKNWYKLIQSHIGKKYNLKTPHYDIDYLISEIDQYGEGDIDRVVIKIDPNGKVDINGTLTLTIKEIYDCKDVYELLDIYFPNVDGSSEQYEEMAHDLDVDFFGENNSFVDSLEENILSKLSSVITKPYGADIDYITIEDGKQEDFEKLKEMSEQFGRIKTLIRYSEY